MRPLRSTFGLILLSLLALLRSEPVDACAFGTFSATATLPRPALDPLLTGPQLPLLSPGWHSEYWVIAWARVHGKTFDAAELASFGDDTQWLHLYPGAGADAAARAWNEDRVQHGFSSHTVSPWRRGENYRSDLVCGADAFLTASATLADRRGRVTPADLDAWILAQDRVFARCADPAAPLPVAPASATQRAKDDYAYQLASATFYGETPAAAEPLFDAIAGSSSSWADIARYRAAYARFRRDAIRGTELRAALGQVTDIKARRGLVQLIDRVELFRQDPATIVDTLGRRLLQESLGADLPRVLRDIVHFAKRVPFDQCAGGLVSVVAGNDLCPGVSEPLALLRRAASEDGWTMPALPGPLLELNRRFHRARRGLFEGELAIARREVRALTRLARDSNGATRNAVEALALATSDDPAAVARHGLRWTLPRSADGVPGRSAREALHADGRAALARLSMAHWLRLLPRVSPELADHIAMNGLVRATLLQDARSARTFMRTLLASTEPRSGEFRGSLGTLSHAADDDELLFGLAMALATHDPADLSVTDELRTPWEFSQVHGCAFGQCGDDHPSQTAVSILPRVTALPASGERRRIENAGRRVDALGDLVFALVTARPGDPRVPELLHHYVQRTRRASVHGLTSPRTGALSRRAYRMLHERYPENPWTERTYHWYS